MIKGWSDNGPPVADASIPGWGPTVDRPSLPVPGWVAILNRLAEDLGIGTDAALVLAHLMGADLGQGKDIAAAKARAAGVDSSVGTDRASGLAHLLGTDLGIGSDVAAWIERRTGAGADLGLGTDMAILKAILKGTDSGQGGDLAYALAHLAGVDAGVGTDRADVWYGNYFFDDFNNRSGYGQYWELNPGGMDNPGSMLLSNSAQPNNALSSGTGRQACSWVMYTLPFLRNNFYVRAQLRATTSSAATNNYTSIFIGGDSTLTDLVSFTCSTGSGSYIVDLSGGTPNGAGGAATGGSRQSNVASAGNTPTTALIEIRLVDGLYTALRNGVSVATYNGGSLDMTGLRRWGMCFEGNRPIFQSSYGSPGIDWIEAGDI